MRAFTSVYSVKLLVVVSLFLIFGCAQNAVSVKEDELNTADTVKLLDLKVTGEGESSRLEITADKPLTYTYYTLREPYRTVIDLSQTDPGAVQAPLPDASSAIKKIDIARNELASGMLTRITLETGEGVELLAAPDLAEKTKVAFIVNSQSPPEPAIMTEAPKQNLSGATDSQLVESTAAVNQIAPPVAPATITGTGAVAAPSKNGDATDIRNKSAQLTVTSIDVVPEGIEIKLGGPVDKYKYFTLTSPERLAIDLFGVKNAIASKTVPVNDMGIVSARIGTYPEKVRIVFDSNKTRFPQFRLEKSGNGLKIVMTGSEVSATREPAVVHVETEKAPAAKASAQSRVAAMVDAIDFSIVDGHSRISVKTTGGCELEGPEKTVDGLSLTFAKCALPKRLQRPFDTSAFASAVKRLTPYQTKIKGRVETKLLVTLREPSPFTLKRDGDVVNLDIKNPELPQAPALVAGRETVAATGIETVVTRRPVAEKVKPGEITSERKYEHKTYTGKRVTLEFADADIRKIFQLIAEVSNLNILVGDDVSGTISIKLVNVPWDQALDVILDTKGLGMKRKDNIVVIRPVAKITSAADEELAAKKAFERTLELQTRIFDVNYASVSDIAGQFNTYKSERGTISVDARTNRVIVNDISPRIEAMAELLKNLDIPEKQVLIEARIVEATSTFTQDLGIQWGIHYRDGSASLFGINSLDTGFGGLITNVPPTSGFQPATAAGGSLGLSFGKLTSNVQIDLRLSAAAETGDVKIISTPKVVTLNNKAAKISQGQMIPYSTVSAEGTKTEFVEAALTLEVTPHITADGSVSMKIKASNNSAGSAATGVAPPINKKEATTELLVQNGETTVIGGIYVDSDSSTDSGVPYLKDIPLLGWLFKSNNQKKTKSELLIFITPKIVS